MKTKKRKTHGVKLQREIDEEMARMRRSKKRGRIHHLDVAVQRPLYGHTSESTAYVVDDYPYGFSARTKIRYWLEHKKGKGFRFVSQTMNPKTGRWNKPKALTYVDWSAAMYLDDNGHVKWEGVGAYSDDQKILTFVRTFPGADMSELRKVAPVKLKVLRQMISGERYFTINGVRQEQSEADLKRLRDEVDTWEEINVWLDQAKS